MIIFIESKTFANEVDQVEKWYGGEYVKASLEKAFLNDLVNRESNPKFAIPGPNIFMPDNFDIEKLETGESEDLGENEILNFNLPLFFRKLQIQKSWISF